MQKQKMTINEALKNAVILLEAMNVPGTETAKHAGALENIKSVILLTERLGRENTRQEPEEGDKHED